jgi:hypothetical protein
MPKSFQKRVKSQSNVSYRPWIAAILPIKSIILNRSDLTISIAQPEQNTVLITKDPQVCSTNR